jgi:hypothetical protein
VPTPATSVDQTPRREFVGGKNGRVQVLVGFQTLHISWHESQRRYRTNSVRISTRGGTPAHCGQPGSANRFRRRSTFGIRKGSGRVETSAMVGAPSLRGVQDTNVEAVAGVGDRGRRLSWRRCPRRCDAVCGGDITIMCRSDDGCVTNRPPHGHDDSDGGLRELAVLRPVGAGPGTGPDSCSGWTRCFKGISR